MAINRSAAAVTSLLAAAMLAGCSLAPAPQAVDNAADTLSPAETILLVSLADGTIVRQTIDLGADICIKSVAESATTCLTEGEPVLNDAGIVVGHEMLADVIDLYDAEQSP